VCQVRNNIVHGEKYMVEEGARSDALVKEAAWVLEQAIESNAAASSYIKTKGPRP
jgi:hypothetical protein